MARTAYFKDEEIVRAHQLRERAKTASELRKALSVLLIAEAGLDAGKTSDILGISERTVFRNRGNIRNHDGVTRNTWGGRRHYRMTIEEEREFLHSWEARAIQGGVLSVPPIHARSGGAIRAFYSLVHDVSFAGSSWLAENTAGHEASEK